MFKLPLRRVIGNGNGRPFANHTHASGGAPRAFDDPVLSRGLSDPGALSPDDFAVDERTGRVEACPQRHTPIVVERNEEAGTTRIAMAAAACEGCPFRTSCPIHQTGDGRYELDFNDFPRFSRLFRCSWGLSGRLSEDHRLFTGGILSVTSRLSCSGGFEPRMQCMFFPFSVQ